MHVIYELMNFQQGGGGGGGGGTSDKLKLQKWVNRKSNPITTKIKSEFVPMSHEHYCQFGKLCD